MTAFDMNRINIAHDIQRHGIRPCSGETWQHQKHNPENPSEWHEYKILLISDGSDYRASDTHRTLYAKNTELPAQQFYVVARQQRVESDRGEYLELDGTGWLFLEDELITVPHVVYQNIVPEVDSSVWARPLEMFCGDRHGKPRFRRVG